jgi:hypothetical protein
MSNTATLERPQIEDTLFGEPGEGAAQLQAETLRCFCTCACRTATDKVVSYFSVSADNGETGNDL